MSLPKATDGHRKRLRQRFLKSGLAGFHDYEIVELLLTFGIPRKDCKPMAKELIRKYKTVSGVVNANDEDLVETPGLGFASIIGIKLAKEIIIHVGQEELSTKKHESIDIKVVARQLISEIGSDKKESFKVVCLNTKGAIIGETVSVGSLNASVVHPREVFKVAIKNSAASVIIAHNHPSGDSTPSDDDILTTRRIVEAGKTLGIDVVDHLIVTDKGYNSLSSAGLI